MNSILDAKMLFAPHQTLNAICLMLSNAVLILISSLVRALRLQHAETVDDGRGDRGYRHRPAAQHARYGQREHRGQHAGRWIARASPLHGSQSISKVNGAENIRGTAWAVLPFRLDMPKAVQRQKHVENSQARKQQRETATDFHAGIRLQSEEKQRMATRTAKGVPVSAVRYEPTDRATRVGSPPSGCASRTP
jgi:hypothetical protein